MAAPQPAMPTVAVDDSKANETSKTDALKKKLWPFGKKKDENKSADGSASSAGQAPQAGLQSTSPSQAPVRSTSPVPVAMGISAPTSPARRIESSSPGAASPASSQIFERNVQEESLAPAEIPTAIPSHIATENHIPPALDATSKAITDNLDPDSVEILTHVSHTPAALTVAHGTSVGGSVSGIAPSSAMAGGPSGLSEVVTSSPRLPATSEEAMSAASTGGGPAAAAGTGLGLEDGAAGSYGSIDTTDVRRLSFISFADVVHAEQAQTMGSETASPIPGAASPLSIPQHPTVTAPGPSLLPSPVGANSPVVQSMSPPIPAAAGLSASPLLAAPAPRSPSPVRAISPPGFRAGSPFRSSSPKMVGTSPSPPTDVVGELAVETMSQALRKTGSGDLSAARERHASIGQSEGA